MALLAAAESTFSRMISEESRLAAGFQAEGVADLLDPVRAPTAFERQWKAAGSNRKYLIRDISRPTEQHLSMRRALAAANASSEHGGEDHAGLI